MVELVIIQYNIVLLVLNGKAFVILRSVETGVYFHECKKKLEVVCSITKMLIENHERHEKARNFSPQNTQNTQKMPRRRWPWC